MSACHLVDVTEPFLPVPAAVGDQCFFTADVRSVQGWGKYGVGALSVPCALEAM